MGACASRPKDLDKELAPAPAEEPATPKKTEEETRAPHEEKKDGEETKKQEPLIDVSEPAPEVPKIEEVTAGNNTAAATEEVKPVKEEETAKEAEEVKVEAVKEQSAEEKEEVEETPKAAAQ
ncbi:hypothetical protein K7X08_035377 [Anisodus acutangulus]|uniref:Uncharacterized protein n=1 Tax=Anisodus acutangulus TaxID=402998 RepID=A0A9Q1LIY0_9SOLA|nr:hypothetical protein K7X08_035377 [Anisodus acutangulus]